MTEQLDEEFNSDKQFIILDKGLNVIHQRSNLASWFVEGGSMSLYDISGQGDDGK